MMNCQKTTQLISEARDRPLSFREHMFMRMHVMMCRGCARFERQVSVLADAAKRLARPPDD